MSAKQNTSPKTKHLDRHTSRGVQPGDKTIMRHKSAKPIPKIAVGDDTLSAIGKRQFYTSRYTGINKVSDPIRLIFDKAGESILGTAKKFNWNAESKKMAHAYLRALVYGPLLDTEEVAKIPQRVKRTVEMRFALSCWFQRRLINDAFIPGMFSDQFTTDYAGAEKRFGKPAPQLETKSFS